MIHLIKQTGAIVVEIKCQPIMVTIRIRIVKNELGESATQKELRGWGPDGINRGTGGLNPHPPVNPNPGNNNRIALNSNESFLSAPSKQFIDLCM